TIHEPSMLTWQLVVASVLGIVVLAGGAVAWQRGALRKTPQVKRVESKLPAKRANLPPLAETTPPAPAPVPEPVKVKRFGEFKVLDHRIERVRGRSLVYVVANVTNEADKPQYAGRVT